jgi:hypothetical protein
MKTLVIHPKDETTDFLTRIYSKHDWTVVNTNMPKHQLKKMIVEYDRIIMLGHGTERGLIGFGDAFIDSNYVYLLRDKIGVYIWCNANVFVEKYGLKGFYTGMIISEYEEALYECVNTTYHEIEESNVLFSNAIEESINKPNMLTEVKNLYITENLNRTMQFNQQNLFENEG